MRLARVVSVVSLALTAGCARAPQPEAPAPAVEPGPRPPSNARTLVAAMRERWNGKYFRTMVFRQKTTLYRQGGAENVSEWLEFQSVPRRLRIEFAPAESRSGLLFRNDSAYSFANGHLADRRAQVHPLLLLSADVYALPVDTTLAGVAALRFDTTQFRADTLAGRRAWVVGAAAGDTASSQFWVDAERMVVLRVIQRQTTPQGRTIVADTRFAEYQDVNGIPVPKVILFLRDGRPSVREEYVEVRLDVPLDEATFDPARWAERFGAASPTGG